MIIAKKKLAEIHDELAGLFDKVGLKGQGPSYFLYAINKCRAVEISEDNGGFWLEFWENSDHEDAGPVKELMIESAERAMEETKGWLAGSRSRQ